MSRSAEDFKKQAKEKGITRWVIHHCSMCDYPCGYLFNGDKVEYDAGCGCVTYRDVQSRTWDNVAEHYNMQKNEKVIAQMDKFWGFTKI